MNGKSDLWKLFFVFTTISLFAVTVSAAEVELEDYNNGDTEWVIEDQSLEDLEVKGMVTCEESPDLKLQPFSGSQTVNLNDQNEFNHQFENSYNYGEFTFMLECSQETDEADLTVNYLDLNSFSYDKNLIYHFEDQGITFDIDFKGTDFNADELDLQLLEFEDAKVEDIQRVGGNEQTVSYSFHITDEEEPTESLQIYWKLVHDSGFELSARGGESFELREPWDINYQNLAQDLAYEELRRQNGELLEIEGAKYRGDEWSFIPTDFRLEIRNDEGDLVDSRDSLKLDTRDGNYVVYMDDFSELPIGEYTFDITITGDSGTDNYEVEPFSVYNYILFEGTVMNAKENTVEAVFDLYRDGNQHWSTFETQSGQYSEAVLPGSHNITVDFEDDVTLNLQEVEFEDDGSKRVMYDRIPKTELQDIEGVTVVKAAGLLFGYGFETGSMRIGYSFGDVDEDQAKIMVCEDWPMSPSRECSGEWQIMDDDEVDVDPTAPEATFSVEPDQHEDREFLMKSYALVKNTDLMLDVDMHETRVPLGQELTIEGGVSTPSGEAVEDVEVEIEILDNEEEIMSSATGQTNSNGVFGVNIDAPSEEGVYDIRISAEKEPYNGMEVTETSVIDTYIERSLDIEGPDQAEFRTGEETEVEYLVVNSGQEELTDLRFHVSGLNNEWYEIEQSSWDEISDGSSKRVQVYVNIPEDYFSSENMENVNFDVEATAQYDGGTVEDMSSTIATITNEHLYSSSSSDEDSSQGDRFSDVSMPSTPTGDFVEETSSLNAALALIIIFALVLATAIKKSDSDDGRKRMDSRNGKVHQRSSAGAGTEMRKSKPELNSEKNGEQEAIRSQTTSQSQDNSPSDESESKDEESDNSETVCSICGEEFDTSSGRKMHEKAIH